MADCRFPCGPSQLTREQVCIECNRILDSCRDRDCFENTRVFLTGFGNDIISRTGSVRVRDAEIVWTSLAVDQVQFNRGFYTVSIRYYVRLTFEACIGLGRSQEFDGIAVLDKTVVLYGGESGVSTFRSDAAGSGFCSIPELCTKSASLPTAVAAVVDPVVLGVKITDIPCSCCCTCGEIPTQVVSGLSGELVDGSGRILTVSLGIFSVVRLVRPGEYIISASEFSVPDKECFEPNENDPCKLFKTMAFPTGEFGFGPPPPNPPGTGCEKRCGSS